MATSQAATLARIEQKLDDVKETLSTHIEAFNLHITTDATEFKSVRAAIVSLRLWQRWFVGVGSGIGLLLGLLGMKELR